MNEIRDGHYTLGKAYLTAERYPEAITHFQQTVELDATFIDGYHALALAYFGAHRLKDAKAAALEALKIDTTHAPTLSFLQALDPGASAPQVSVAPSEPPDGVATQAETENTAKPTAEPVPPTPDNKEETPPKADAANDTDEIFISIDLMPVRSACFRLRAGTALRVSHAGCSSARTPYRKNLRESCNTDIIEITSKQSLPIGCPLNFANKIAASFGLEADGARLILRTGICRQPNPYIGSP